MHAGGSLEQAEPRRKALPKALKVWSLESTWLDYVVGGVDVQSGEIHTAAI